MYIISYEFLFCHIIVSNLYSNIFIIISFQIPIWRTNICPYWSNGKKKLSIEWIIIPEHTWTKIPWLHIFSLHYWWSHLQVQITHSSIHDQLSHLNKAYIPIYITETGLSLYNACKIIKNIRFYKTFVPKNFIITTFN